MTLLHTAQQKAPGSVCKWRREWGEKSLNELRKQSVLGEDTNCSTHIHFFFHSQRLKCQMSLGSNEGQVGHYDQGQSSVSIKSRAELCPRHRGQL